MLRFAKFMIVMGAIAVFFGAIALGFILILSGGDPVGYARNLYLRFTISSRQDDLQQPAGFDTSERPFLIESGDTPISVSLKLRDQSLINDAQLFVDYMVVEGYDTQLQSGAFFLSQAQTIPEIVATITDRRNAGITFAVLAGSRLEEIAEAITALGRFNFTGDEFLAITMNGAQIAPEWSNLLGIPSGASLEGFMFPATYIFSPNVTVVEMRDTLISQFIESVGAQLLADANNQALSMRDAVIIASIVEREAVWDDEHTLIASVYRNRLNIDMKLDADPTIQYALNGARGRWWPSITQADYRGVVSVYNTYLNYGLPPSPISNPSLSAIRAAIYPAESSYLYFRARCDGSNYHAFSTTYDEHLANGC